MFLSFYILQWKESVLVRGNVIFGLNLIQKENVLSMISEDDRTKELVKAYTNTKVRAGEPIKDPKRHTQGLIAYIYDKLKVWV